jgi:type II secretory pathway pseudopilin PulG
VLLAHNHRGAVDAPTGMTLVELLVVIGVLLLLLVAVVPILSPSADQKGREAAATVASMINRVKARIDSAGDNASAGLWLEPLLTSGSVRIVPPNAVAQTDGVNMAMATLDMFVCEPQDNYNGDDPVAARAYVYQPNQPPQYVFVPGFRTDEALVLFEQRSCFFVRELCGQSSRITIPPGGPQTYLFRLLTTAEQASLGENYFPQPYRPCNEGLAPSDLDLWKDPADPSSGYYAGYGDSLAAAAGGPAPKLVVGWIRSLDGGSFGARGPFSDPFNPNASPPTFPVPGGESFAIARPNTRSATPPLSVPEGYAIDVAWSSYGTLLLHNSADARRAGNGNMQLVDNILANQPIQVMFDSAGSLKKVIVRRFVRSFGVGTGSIVEDTIELTTDLFLLVGRADRVGRPYVANPTEANPGANWQYPDSRWIKVSRATGNTVIADPYLGVDNVYDSQTYARSDVAAVRN